MKELAVRRNNIRLSESDSVFEYGQAYTYFGIYAPPNMELANPDIFLRRLMKLATYCKQNRVKPVAVFVYDNLPVSTMCRHLGILTVCLHPTASTYDKVVFDATDFTSLTTCYWVTNSDERPKELDDIEAHDGTIIEVPGAVGKPTEARDVVNPNKVVRSKPLPKSPTGDYENFPLGEPVKDLTEPSLPMELPQGLTDVVDRAKNASDQQADGIRQQTR